MRTIILVGVLVLAACGGGEPSTDSTLGSVPTTPESTAPSTVPSTSLPGDNRGEGADLSGLSEAELEIVETAVADLSERTGSSRADIVVASFERVTWNDGSLGCPKPGEVYTQALVEGSRTVLEVEDTSYSYHSNASGPPFLCEDPGLSPRPGSKVTPPDEGER